uniref:Reverse transcriptase domain-containing protein n=1 Tax=Anabas testudineus TaxID=64144 RepID=A0A3Q1KE20_ANATE
MCESDSVESVANPEPKSIGSSLCDEEVALCEGEIGLDKVKLAVAALNHAKSPGSDGLTAEFYQCYVDLLGPVLCRLFFAMQEEQRCAESFLKGVITLVYKKGDRADLVNYRPINSIQFNSILFSNQTLHHQQTRVISESWEDSI